MRDNWTHLFVAERRAPTLKRDKEKKGEWTPTIRVTAGLRDFEGNRHPYFSVTAVVFYPRHRDRPFAAGQLHDEVLEYFPMLEEAVALHLCDDTGAPMHAEQNAWYRLAGFYACAWDRHHMGTSEHNFELPADRRDPDKPWVTTEYRRPTREECLESFARFVRIDMLEATTLALKWSTVGKPWGRVREDMNAWIHTQRPRWQREANEVCALLDIQAQLERIRTLTNNEEKTV